MSVNYTNPYPMAAMTSSQLLKDQVEVALEDKRKMMVDQEEVLFGSKQLP